MQNGSSLPNNKVLQPSVSKGSKDGESQTDNCVDTILIENLSVCTAHSSFESSASSFSPLRSHSSFPPRCIDYIKERACTNLICHNWALQISSSVPVIAIQLTLTLGLRAQKVAKLAVVCGAYLRHNR